MDRRHSRRNIAGHSPYEQVVGYSRAVVAGSEIRVAGTAPIPRDGEPPVDAYGLTKLCLEIFGGALEVAVHADEYDEVARAHGEVFSAIRPASTAIVVKALLDPRWRIEIEADAVLG